MNPPKPTDAASRPDSELSRWSHIYAGVEYFYGDEPGPLVRRSVRYHQSWTGGGGPALDAGCGEGQDAAFLAERGYDVTAIDFVPDGVAKAERLLAARGLSARMVTGNLRTGPPAAPGGAAGYSLVVAANSVQFLGEDAPACLDRLMEAVAPGGVLGLSLFGRDEGEQVAGTLYFVSLEALLGRFRNWQPLEAARLWQWDVANNHPQPFVTLVARNVPPSRRVNLVRL
jgi:SAM-dependent methyltransferase